MPLNCLHNYFQLYENHYASQSEHECKSELVRYPNPPSENHDYKWSTKEHFDILILSYGYHDDTYVEQPAELIEWPENLTVTW